MLQVWVPVAPPEQVHDWDVFGRQARPLQSPQVPHAVPELLHVCAPRDPPEHVHCCTAFGVQTWGQVHAPYALPEPLQV